MQTKRRWIRQAATCSVPNCAKAPHSRGWCKTHYSRWLRTGTVIAKTPADRFMAFVNKVPGGCWLWTGGTDKDGYGRFGVNGKTVPAHRWAMEQVTGEPIPPGMQVDHLCRTPACVFVPHLEVVTPQENTLRGVSPAAVNAAKTHCKNGHPFAGDNLVKRPDGARGCRACLRAADRRYKEKKRATR